MKLDVRFEDIGKLLDTYDPVSVKKAAHATIKQLNGRAATEISKAVRSKYNVKAGDVKSVLRQRLKYQGDIPVGYLVYLSKRISLRHFATGTRVKVKTSKGIRYGARAKVRKDSRASLVSGGFYGKAKTSGALQIFKREGEGRLPVKKLTAPAISQMVGGKAPIAALNDMVQREANAKMSANLDFFLKKKTGIL